MFESVLEERGDVAVTLVNCDNCNREFDKQPNKLLGCRHDYCCYACRYYHQVYSPRAVKNRSYRKIKFFAYVRSLECRGVGEILK